MSKNQQSVQTQEIIRYDVFVVEDFTVLQRKFEGWKFGGKSIAATRDVVAKEDQSSGNLTAIIRFPSKEAATAM